MNRIHVMITVSWVLPFILSIAAYGQKVDYVLSTPNDTTQNFYVSIRPKGEIRGTLILLPGFGQLPQETLIETDIYKLSSKEGYFTIIPALGDWSFFYLDSASHYHLHVFLDEIFEKYRLPKENFFIGGFSLGGTMAVQYAERANLPDSKLRKPTGVFAIDPPLDWERMYDRMLDKSRKLHPASLEENNYFSTQVNETFKTNPKDNPRYFWNVSPFSKSDTSHSALKSILKIPVRLYTEPDINWYIEKRYSDYYDLNGMDCSAMVNWLRILGNDRAELIVTTGKGYRIARKQRHPHSWSIADAKGVVEWMEANRVRK